MRIHGTLSASSPPVVRTSLKAKEYSMSRPRLGKCVIFNNKGWERVFRAYKPSSFTQNFDLHTNKPERTGTDLDANDLRSTFRDLGFETVRYNDLSCKETKDTLKNLGEQDYSDDDCFVCCFLTHGDSDVLYATDGKFPVGAVMEPFHGDVCPSLLGKPKLFFIQACRGDTLKSGTQAVKDAADSPTRVFRIPTHADVLVAYSTVPGFYSWHDSTEGSMRGSWFIQALCSVLRERAHFADVLSMLTVVCRRVSLDCELYTPNDLHMHCKKQVPFITSTLTRLVYFMAKLGAAYS
ncbi:hypothetical protein HPB52_016381 [Rhipicephalus sanguineus]|uniref:Caspase n=1 Tax=Rhipicephalus sanguineus TaxID=34632 RepID=A0A9D4PE92_RHISA|nr:hypothetical protein HPB52_016381 [Rhipicephalus sanguineus]